MRARTTFLLAALLTLAGCAREPEGAKFTWTGLLSFSGTAPMDRLPENRAGDVIRRGIDFGTGGWEAWTEKRTVAYRKTTLQLGPEGEVERRVVQTHRYRLHPGPKMRVEWEDAGRRIVLVNKGDQAWKFVDGEPATTQQDRDEAWNATFGSHYVFCMPYKLTDPGARLTYAGETVLDDGTRAEMVQVDYEPGAGSAGGMHTWTYYFDAEDGRLVANHLQYGPGPDDHSFTEYADYRVIDGVHMPTRRYGYRSNARRERLEKVSEIFYEDVRFDAPLPDSLFVPLTRTAL